MRRERVEKAARRLVFHRPTEPRVMAKQAHDLWDKLARSTPVGESQTVAVDAEPFHPMRGRNTSELFDLAVESPRAAGLEWPTMVARRPPKSLNAAPSGVERHKAKRALE